MYTIDLSGQVALVTGSSRGIGAAIAKALAAAGASVGINYRTNADAADRVIDEIRAAGGEALRVPGDVSDENAAEAVVKTTADRLGRLDILVNNAGITRDRLVMRMNAADWDDVLTVNLRGTFLPTRFAIPLMVRQRYGRVVNVSSVVGLSGNPGPGQLRGVQGRPDRDGQGHCAGGSQPEHHGQRGRAGIHRVGDDRRHDGRTE